MKRKTQPEGLYGDSRGGQDHLIYNELVKLNKSARVIRQWVTWIGVLMTLCGLGLLLLLLGSLAAMGA
jgi:hypothetical protein